MKKLSIRFKITLWFSIALVLVVSLTYLAIFTVARQIIHKDIRDKLISTVENNVDEIEYFSDVEDSSPDSDADYFLPYKDGYLEVDDDFLNIVNLIYTSLYLSDGTFIYGENPIAGESVNLAFKDSQVQQLTVNGTLYYIFDRKLTSHGLDGLWLRGVVSEKQGEVSLESTKHISLIILPGFVFLAILGGSIIAKRSLYPIRKISEAAISIRESGDLKKRIDIGQGKDELHQLADNFNQMFDRLEASFQAERRFSSDVSHELRTPMSVIMAQCELSLEEASSPEDYREALIVIKRQGEKMSRLIRDMLDFSRLEMNSERYSKEPFDLSSMVESLCSDMALIRENQISLQYKIEQDIRISGNRDLMIRLLSNLISNAYRYGKKEGHILVTLRKDRQSILLSVRDDGIGIAPEEREKIFHCFYQSDAARSGPGSGLGLSMVQEIARFHKGQVTLESQFGQGSIFTVTFPL